MSTPHGETPSVSKADSYPGRNHRLLPALAKNVPLARFLNASRLPEGALASSVIPKRDATFPVNGEGLVGVHPYPQLPAAAAQQTNGTSGDFAEASFRRMRTIQAILCNQSRQTKQPLAQPPKGHEGVRGNRRFCDSPGRSLVLSRERESTSLHKRGAAKHRRASNARPYGWRKQGRVRCSGRGKPLPYGRARGRFIYHPRRA